MEFPKPINSRFCNEPLLPNNNFIGGVGRGMPIEPVQNIINKQSRTINEYPDISNRIFDNVIEMQNKESNLTQYFQRPIRNVIPDSNLVPQMSRNRINKNNRDDEMMYMNHNRYINDFQDRFNGYSMIPKDTRIEKGGNENDIGRTMKTCASLPPNMFNH